MKMNRVNTVINCLLVSVLLFTSCKPSRSELTESDIQYIKELNTSAQDGWNRGDREPYVSRYATNAIYMPPNTETVVGKDAIRTFANALPEVKVKFNTEEITGSADYAYVRGAYTVTNPIDSLLDKGKFLSVWIKTDDKWIVTNDIFNSDMPPRLMHMNTGEEE